MKRSKELDELFEEMKEIERSEVAKRNTWLALKAKIETKRKHNFFPAIISLAIVVLASFLIITYVFPSKTNQTAGTLSNEAVIRAVLDKEYNGPDMDLLRLTNDWWNLQSETEAKTQEEYNQLLESKEYQDLMAYFDTTYGAYFTEDMLTKAINANLVFKYNHLLIDHDIEMQIEKVTIKQEKDHPTIYRPVIEVSLMNNQGDKIFHTVREEFIFSTTEPGKIGSYNGTKNGGGMELQEKIENFNAYVGNQQDVRTASIRETLSFDTLCFTGKMYESEKEKNLHGCTSNSKKINPILNNFENLPIKEATEQESIERAEALTQIDNFQIYLSNKEDVGSTLYTITLFKDGVMMFAPDFDLGISGDTTTEPNILVYEQVKIMLNEFAEQ